MATQNLKHLSLIYTFGNLVKYHLDCSGLFNLQPLEAPNCDVTQICQFHRKFVVFTMRVGEKDHKNPCMV